MKLAQTLVPFAGFVVLIYLASSRLFKSQFKVIPLSIVMSGLMAGWAAAVSPTERPTCSCRPSR